MKTIEEIREIYKKATNIESVVSKELRKINKKLYNYARQGKSYITYTLNEELRDEVITKLTEEGYIVDVSTVIPESSKIKLIIKLCE